MNRSQFVQLLKRLDSSEKDCRPTQQLATQRQRMGDYCILSKQKLPEGVRCVEETLKTLKIRY